MLSSSVDHRHPSLLPSSTNNLRKRSGMNSKQPLLPSTMPSYNVPSEDKSSEPPVRRSKDVRRLSWGIFQVAYGAPVRHISLSGLRQSLRDLRHSAPCAGRLLVEIYTTARVPVAVHLLAAMLLVIAPAFALYLSASILGIVQESVISRRISESHVSALQGLGFMWLFIAIMSILANRIMDDTAFALKGHLRGHFLPQLVNASLRLDMGALQSRKALRDLPQEYTFDMEVPGFDFFHNVIARLRHFLTLVAEVGVLVMVISRGEFREARVLAFFSFMLPAVMLLKPSTGVGGAGYVFWTPNVDYYYLAALYKLAFSHQFRPTLARDNMCSFISQEYERVSRALGYMNVETLTIQASIQVQWYWDILHSLIVDYSLAVCVVMLPWADPLSSLVTMVLVQHVTMTLRQSIYHLRGIQGPDTLAEIFGWADRLYEAIALENELHRGTVSYPEPQNKEKGMEIKFEGISFRRRADGPPAVSDVNVTIPAGKLAVVVGANGSGKSSLLSLIPGLLQPSEGRILIDGRPLNEYNVESLRGAMACISQDEDMYPLSLRANMLMGAPRDPGDDSMLKEAAERGCATDLIDRLPSKWDTILEPASTSAQCMQGCGNGYISTAAFRELEEHGPSFAQTVVSGGERQRLAATRMFSRLLRLKDRVRLIVCDEATGALDPVAENHILQSLKGLKCGKTVILVTHRLGQLVEEADIILFMADGKLVDSGPHTELMASCEQYAEMFNKAQAGAGSGTTL